MFNVALVQAELIWENVRGNLERFDERIGAIEGADLIVLPEMFSSGFTMTAKEKIAEYYEEVADRMKRWAEQKEALIIGSTVYREKEHYFNRLLAVGPDGETAVYDKRHCFTMGGEKEHFTPGDALLRINYKGFRIAAFICYDLRFPVWCRNTDRYDVAVFVANWPEARREVWKLLLKARAVENQAYVVGVNCVGKDGNGLSYAGDSVIVSPRGEVIASCLPYEDVVVSFGLDSDVLETFRSRFPVLDDRDIFYLE